MIDKNRDLTWMRPNDTVEYFFTSVRGMPRAICQAIAEVKGWEQKGTV